MSIVPKVVYHYTTVQSMMSIVNSASIWATSICYLNDISEQELYLTYLRNGIPPFVREHELSSADRQIVESLMLPDKNSFENRPFVASFSRFEDSLPQWRSYCPNGNGVAIGFNVNCLEGAFVSDNNGERLPSPMVQLGEVEYVDTSQKRDLSPIYLGQLALAKEFAERLNTKDISFCFRYLNLRFACFRKHHGFSNEAEYRLVSDGLINHYELLNFRTSRSTLVPYLEVKIPENFIPLGDGVSSTSNQRQRFISRVIVGPTANKELSCSAIKAFFMKKGLAIEVESSKIPFREW